MIGGFFAAVLRYKPAVVWVGYMERERTEGHSEQTHTDHTVGYCAGGRFRMIHGETIDVGPGAITIVPAGAPHQMLDGGPIKVWVMSFCATCYSLDESQPLMSAFRRVRLGALPFGIVAEDRRDHLVSLFSELIDESHHGPGEPDVIRSLIVLILREVRSAMPAASDADAAKGSLVADALAFIQRRCLEPISLRDVAAAVNKAPAHVAATVKKATGYSVGQWITEGRLSEACARLVHTDDTVEEIGYRVGWNDATHFIRQFRKAFGQTPAQWRKANRAAHPRVTR